MALIEVKSSFNTIFHLHNGSQIGLFLRGVPLENCMHFSYLTYMYKPHPSHLSSADISNNMSLVQNSLVQNVKLLIMKFSPASCYCLPIWTKCVPQHLFSNNINLQCSLIERDELSSASKISCSPSLCAFNPYIFLREMGRKNSEMNATS
jgi:hypothetical protein